MEILIMLAIGGATLGLIWLIVREPVQIMHRERNHFMPMPPVKPTRVEVSQFTLDQLRAESAQEVRVNAGIPRAYAKPVEKPVDKPKPKTYSGSTSGSSSSRSSRSSSDDGYSSYSSWGGDSSSSSSSSCDSSSSSSSSSSCD